LTSDYPDLVFVANGDNNPNNGMRVVDVSNPAAPVLKSEWGREVEGDANAVFVEKVDDNSGCAYIADGSKGVKIHALSKFDTLANTQDSDRVAILTYQGGTAFDVTKSSTTLYTAAGAAGVFYCNDCTCVGPPYYTSKSKLPVSQITLNDRWAMRLVVREQFMYVFCHRGSFAGYIIVVDLTAGPSQATFLKIVLETNLYQLRPNGNLVLEGGYLFVATSSNYLHVRIYT
jgi:hypothetical protein